MTPRVREILGRLGLVLGSAFVVLLLAEVALRAIGFAPERYKSLARLAAGDGRLLLDCYPTNPRGYFDIDLREPAARERYSFLAPHRFEAVAHRAPWAVEFHYNANGFRDRELGPKRPGVRRVLVLGDSFTEGQGVKEADTLPRVLERLLTAAEPGRWEVGNCAQRATDFPKLYAIFQEIEGLEPDLLVYAMVPNDPERSEEFEARQTYVNDWIINRGRMLIGRPDDRPDFFQSRLLSLIADRVESYRIGRETARWYRDMYGPANADGWERTTGYIREMNERTRRRGARFLIVTWPLLVGLDGGYPFAAVSEAVHRLCLATGIPRHDLLPVLAGRPSESLWVHPVDMHPNEIAHRLAAESLAPVVRRLVGDGGP
jgi:lysophospholipase L1-like esterase